MTKEVVRDILRDVSYRNWTLHVGEDDGGRMFFQCRFIAYDRTTDRAEWQYARKWWLSPHMTETEIVTTAFKAILAAEEHEVKEHFLYKKKRVFDPHTHISALLRACGELDARS